jgi:hypothetical protein
MIFLDEYRKERGKTADPSAGSIFLKEICRVYLISNYNLLTMAFLHAPKAIP